MTSIVPFSLFDNTAAITEEQLDMFPIATASVGEPEPAFEPLIQPLEGELVDDAPRLGRESEIFFPVSIVPIAAITKNDILEAEGYRAIVREDTGTILGVHGKNYKLVTNETVFNAIDDAIHNSGLDTSRMSIKDYISHGGGRCFRKYRFDNYAIETSQGDSTVLQVVFFNSYDGSWTVSLDIGGFRIACANGQVIGDSMFSMVKRHTANIDFSALRSRMQASLDLFLQQGEVWKKWMTAPVFDEQAHNVFTYLPGTNERMLGRLDASWDNHKALMGSNVFSLYNTLTHWSTHADVRQSSKANAASVLVEREARVKQVIPHLHRLAA